jgi:Tol biopolymer transport system component
MVAFSINSPSQWHHAVGDSRDVFDYASELAVYDLRTGSLVSNPEISNPDYLETLPAWSPDGKYLYFSRARRSWPADLRQRNMFPLEYFDKVRYDLCRIAFDIDQGAWGKLETLLTADETGQSINEPRVSPDGRFLLFCMHDYGSFPVFRRSSDLYMMNLQTRRHRKLDINSDRSDSWHCWSSNGRWIVFASKRRDGLFGRLYFSYVDAEGKVRKPFLLPQKDPTFYDTCLENFNVPELIQAPVSIEQRSLLAATASDAEKADDGPGTP